MVIDANNINDDLRPYKNEEKQYHEKIERYCASADSNVTFNVTYDDNLTEWCECLNYQSCENKSKCEKINKC